MDKKISSQELYNIIKNNEIIGVGSCAIIYKYSDDLLFKFKARDFADALGIEKDDARNLTATQISKAIKVKNSQSNSFKYFKQKQKEDDLRKIIKKGKNLKYSNPTKSMVFVDDVCVGYILPYHKNMISLKDFSQEKNITHKQNEKVFENIKRAIFELSENFIYHPDLTYGNILINPKTSDIQIIDFEDNVEISNERYIMGEFSYERNLKLIANLLNVKQSDEKSL